MIEKIITARIPAHLPQEAAKIVLQGGAMSLDSLLAEALKRYLDTKKIPLEKKFLEEDLNWGLNRVD